MTTPVHDPWREDLASQDATTTAAAGTAESSSNFGHWGDTPQPAGTDDIYASTAQHSPDFLTESSPWSGIAAAPPHTAVDRRVSDDAGDATEASPLLLRAESDYDSDEADWGVYSYADVRGR